MTNVSMLHVPGLMAMAIAGWKEVEIKNEDYRKYPEEAKNRITTLGLNALLEAKELDATQQLDILERNVWRLASTIKKKRFGYKETDFINSLNFLESFCLYAGQANMASGRNEKVIEERNDKTLLKAVKKIEYINKLLQSDMEKRGKVTLKKHIDILNNYIDKILTRNLSQTEQIAMGKIVNKAESILNKI